MKKEIYKISTVVFILDQLVKFVVMSIFSYQEISFFIPKFLYFTYVKNTGGAWSILSNNFLFLLVVGIFSMLGLVYYIYKKQEFNFIEVIYLGIITGGILGNFVDRIFRGGVVDYIGFIFGNYYFPIFNIADICIVCGAVLLIIDSFRGNSNEIRSNER